MRRSAAVEALSGGAEPAALSSKLANQIATNQELQRTYLPVDAQTVAVVDAARIEARRQARRR
jgi:hypothetical protein